MVTFGIILSGIVWIAVVAWSMGYFLDRADVVVAEGLIREPSTAQVVVAYLSAVIFALPGVGLIVYGLVRRQRAGGHRHDEVSA